MTTLLAQATTRRDPWVVLEGQATVEAALAGWWEVAGVMLCDAHPWEVPAWSGLEVVRKPLSAFAGLADPARHGGVLGLARQPAETAEVAAFAKGLEAEALLVVCPKLEDPVLAGTVARHAERIGAAGVLFGAEGVSPFGAAAVAASDGAVFRLPVRVADSGQLLRSLKAAAVDLTGLEPGADPAGVMRPDGRRALVVGDPERGLGPFWRAACDRWGGGEMESLLRRLAVQAG
jgi:tRNA G18 (ribose-2'-O)-methylase SpoU